MTLATTIDNVKTQRAIISRKLAVTLCKKEQEEREEEGGGGWRAYLCATLQRTSSRRYLGIVARAHDPSDFSRM